MNKGGADAIKVREKMTDTLSDRIHRVGESFKPETFITIKGNYFKEEDVREKLLEVVNAIDKKFVMNILMEEVTIDEEMEMKFINILNVQNKIIDILKSIMGEKLMEKEK